MPAPAQQQSVSPVASWRVAIIDDVYAGPTREAVKHSLAEFCADVGADESLIQVLHDRTQCNFADADNVTDAGIVALYTCREQLTDIAGQLEKLFLEFDQRHNEVATIEQNLKAYGFVDANIKTFQSVQDLFSGEPFQLVFLDLLLAKGEAESQSIAKEIYEKFKAFILLMSNSPIINPQQVEGFRRETRLLSGFFEFRAKSDLCDKDKFRIQIETLPKDPVVCHAVHNFVMALEEALGGPIDEPAMNEGAAAADPRPSVLPQFMHSLRALGLHDYALLCELTLRNEGHPLGDYMLRLLGAHLLAKILLHPRVKSAVSALDTLRFTEFLPFGDECSTSFHRMYADATTEAVTGPWGPHPWSVVRDPAASGAAAGEATTDKPAETDEAAASQPDAAAVQDAENVSEILALLGMHDDEKELPYMQMGDLLVKDEKSLVFAVLSASCELQFVPTHIHKDRERLRDDTVLLVPGRMRTVGAPQAKKSQTTAGLIEWNDTPYCIDWFDGKLVGLPHCTLRKLLEDRGYLHHRRLQTARALELQQAVLSKLSRIGLEVRPPFPRDIKITLFNRQTDQSFVMLGDSVAQGGLLFHGRKTDQRVLVLRRSAFFYFTGEMKKHADQVASDASADPKLKAGLPTAATAFMAAMGGLKMPIEIPTSTEAKAIQLVDSSGKKQAVKQVALRFGAFTEAPVSTNKELMFCLSAEEE
ncbi:MAG: hypothetical protein IPM20_12560 [Gammaproteobacteria bacterium]|nr:hypothetical protein [Gammaproteobacteria bacterium]